MAETADTRAIDELGRDLTRIKRQVLGRLAERGYQLLRIEVPKRTRNLMQGVAAPDVDYDAMTAVLIVSARSARFGERTATLIGADGEEKKKVSLRAQAGYNYAAVVAEGYKARIRPKSAKALLIPVPTAPNGESYLLVDGEVFVFRRSTKGIKANPYHERAGKRLEDEAPKIADSVLDKFV